VVALEAACAALGRTKLISFNGCGHPSTAGPNL
jgi:hypothetical protein